MSAPPKLLSGRKVSIIHPAMRAYDIDRDEIIYHLRDAVWSVDFAAEGNRLATAGNSFIRAAGDGWIVAHIIIPAAYRTRTNVVMLVSDDSGIGHGIIFEPIYVTLGELLELVDEKVWPEACRRRISEAYRFVVTLDEPTAEDFAQADQHYAERSLPAGARLEEAAQALLRPDKAEA